MKTIFNQLLFSTLSVLAFSGALQAEEVSPLIAKAQKELSRPIKDLGITSEDLTQAEAILFESLTTQGLTEAEQKDVLDALHQDLAFASNLVNGFLFQFIWPDAKRLTQNSRHFTNLKSALKDGDRRLAQVAFLALVAELNLCSSLSTCKAIQKRLGNTDL